MPDKYVESTSEEGWMLVTLSCRKRLQKIVSAPIPKAASAVDKPFYLLDLKSLRSEKSVSKSCSDRDHLKAFT